MSTERPESPRAPKGRQLSARERLWGLLAVLGIVALLVFLRDPTEPSPAVELALPELAPLSTRWSEEVPSSPAWQDAIGLYERGVYEQAAHAFGALAAGPGDRADLANLYLGSSQLFLARRQEAELALRLAARSADPGLAAEARWLLAQTLLRAEQPEAARAELEKLAGGTDERADLARTLLDQLGTQVAPPR